MKWINLHRFMLLMLLSAGLSLGVMTEANADTSVGADVVSRYVWRGSDIGDAVSVQPSLDVDFGNISVGAWASYALDGGGVNENDLWVSAVINESLSVSITDYYFPDPGGHFFSLSDGDEVHVFEVGASYDLGTLALSVNYNVSGDPDNSAYIQADYALGDVLGGDATLIVGAGNEAYTSNGDPSIVVVGLRVNSGKSLSATYILNMDTETSYLVARWSL